MHFNIFRYIINVNLFLGEFFMINSTNLIKAKLNNSYYCYYR
nr:MAG TPA: hypothetical protein [Caudoviricetes sp.]